METLYALLIDNTHTRGTLSYHLAPVLQWIDAGPGSALDYRLSAVVRLPFRRPDKPAELAHIDTVREWSQVTQGYFCVGFTSLEDADQLKNLVKKLKPEAVKERGRMVKSYGWAG